MANMVPSTPSGLVGALVSKSRRMVAEQVDDFKQVGHTIKHSAHSVRQGAARLSSDNLDDVYRKGKERLSSGVAEAADSWRSAISHPPLPSQFAAKAVDAASAVGESLKGGNENEQAEVLLRAKNKRILELEEEKTQLQASLRSAMSDSALADAVALAKKKEAEVELIKQRTVAKFKELTAEKNEAEEAKRELASKLERSERELLALRRGSSDSPSPLGTPATPHRACRGGSLEESSTPATPAMQATTAFTSPPLSRQMEAWSSSSLHFPLCAQASSDQLSKASSELRRMQ
ncbi:MAG: hypothetical protein SGPRY_014021, partial [Prymnesium sp.]